MQPLCNLSSCEGLMIWEKHYSVETVNKKTGLETRKGLINIVIIPNCSHFPWTFMLLSCIHVVCYIHKCNKIVLSVFNKKITYANCTELQKTLDKKVSAKWIDDHYHTNRYTYKLPLHNEESLICMIHIKHARYIMCQTFKKYAKIYKLIVPSKLEKCMVATLP